MDLVDIPQINGNGPSENPDAQALALTGNTAVDLANVAKELGVTLDAAGNVATEHTDAQPVAVTPTPRAPAQPQAAPVKTEAAADVPAKFQNADGTPNVEKIEKSTKSVEEMLAYYRAKEREAHQAQNRVNNPAPNAPVTVAPQTTQLSPLEYQMAQDLIAEHSAQGINLDQRSAIAQARVMARGLEAKHAAEANMTESLRREVGEQRMTAELKDLMAADQDLLTPEVADRVLAIKQANPQMRSYREAYIQHLGEQAIAQRTGQVKTPTPTGQAAKAPPTPVGPVTRVQRTVDISNPHSMTTEQLEAEARKMFPGLRLGSRL